MTATTTVPNPTPTAPRKRCFWCEGDPLYEAYHDEEWGQAVHDDAKLFEMLMLECFQAGLSWRTVLHKRAAFRAACDGFDLAKVRHYDEAKIDELMQNQAIIRHRKKLAALRVNAEAFVRVQDEFGCFAAYLWGFTQGQVLVYRPQTREQIHVKTALSDDIARDLKQRGFKFVGSTTVYAYLQAVGVVNEHMADCFKAT